MTIFILLRKDTSMFQESYNSDFAESITRVCKDANNLFSKNTETFFLTHISTQLFLQTIMGFVFLYCYNKAKV